jgi:hypothetical protein
VPTAVHLCFGYAAVVPGASLPVASARVGLIAAAPDEVPAGQGMLQ